MQLGAFSVSLAVRDIAISRQFYEKLGFKVFGGDEAESWLIMKNGDHLIGLFQGMFEQNILTFNPGWDQNASLTKSGPDVRAIQEALKAAGLTLQSEVEPDTSGPGSLTLSDPDGNLILIDQHI
ncbi:MAG: glyoxalase [Oleiphilus sp.]|nr:MAG: glyoxalase [Oleiphilus sp.]